MTIIVNELVFKGTITDAQQEGKAVTKTQTTQPDPRHLVELCVEEVMAALERGKER